MTEPGERIFLIRGVRIAAGAEGFFGEDDAVDILIDDGRVADIAPVGALSSRGAILDAEGCWAVPGLWDHHVHTVQWALNAQRTPLGEATSPAHAARLVADGPVLGDGRRIGTGFRDALWGDRPTLAQLDAVTGVIPTYLINADVHSVWMNSAAFQREGFAATADGMLREEPAFEISRRLNAADDSVADAAVLAAARRAAARGVTGLVDFDMAWTAESWRRRCAAGFDLHRVEFAIYPARLVRAIAEGLRGGEVLSGTGELVSVGPLKLIIDGSLGTRTAATTQPYAGGGGGRGELTIPQDELMDVLAQAAGGGLSAAMHAIGDRALAAALDAATFVQAHGTIEHAQLIQHGDLARMARLGLAASVQPQHALDDRDLADDLWRHQTSLAYPLASLERAGVTLRFGSDAPVAPLDPWVAIAAAVARTDGEREPWMPEERVSVDTALRASSRHGNADLAPGAQADIALCAADPRTASREELAKMPIAATLLAGRVTHIG